MKNHVSQCNSLFRYILAMHLCYENADEESLIEFVALVVVSMFNISSRN